MQETNPTIPETPNSDAKIYQAGQKSARPWMDCEYVEIDEELSQLFDDARLGVTLASTIFAYVVPRVTYKFSKDIETACAIVDGDENLIVFNPDLFRDLISTKARAFMLLHELQHIFMFHHARAKEMRYHPILWNYATDFFINNIILGMYRDGYGNIAYNKRYQDYIGININDYISNNVLPVPHIPEEEWKRLKVLSNPEYLDMTPDEIYDVILNSLPKELQEQIMEEVAGGYAGDEAGNTTVKIQVGSGGDGDQDDGEEGSGKGDDGDGDGGSGRKSVEDQLKDHFGGVPQDELMGDGGSPEQRQKNQQTIAAAVSFAESQANGVGNNEGNIVRMVVEMNKPQVKWQDIIHETIVSKGDSYNTYLKYNSRTTGDVILPSTYTHTIDVCVQADTSGSMGTEDYKDVVGELYGLVEQFEDWRITLATCDVKHHIIGDYCSMDGDDWESIDLSLPGGGGTILTPMVKYAEDEAYFEQRKIAANIIITDGYFNPNELVEGMGDHLWLVEHIIIITRGGNREFELDHPNFKVIKLDFENQMAA